MTKDPFEPHTETKSSKASVLEWHEAAADTTSDVEGHVEEPRPHGSQAWLVALIVISCSLLLGRLFILQITQGNDFRILAENNRLRTQPVPAARGLIKDRYGEDLVQNVASFQLVATPLDLLKPALADEVRELSMLLGLDEAEVHTQLANVNFKSYQPVLIKQNLTNDQNLLFQTRSQDFPGFAITPTPIRNYLSAPVFSHVLGYTGIVSTEDLNQPDSAYQPTDVVGKAGIELAYDKYLQGVDGENQIEVNAANSLVNILGSTDPQTGNTVELNIDKGLQEVLYKGFSSRQKSTKGSALALNPKTGEVLALVSVPGFDNNQFAQGISQNDYQKLLDDKSLPLFNRAVSGTYPPGSTVKMMVGLAALAEGIVNENTVIVDRGNLAVPNQFNPSQVYNFVGWKPSGLGPMTVRSAIAESSDIYFYSVSGGNPAVDIQGLGAEKLAEYYKKFHLGQNSGIDIQGEKPGLVPDPEWKARYYNNDPIAGKWYLGDTYHVGIGQGDLLVTPLQVALWTAAIANNGTMYKPYLLKSVHDTNGKLVHKTSSEVLVNRFSDERHMKIIQEGMRQTVTSGTGRQLATLSISSAGKTGTSQFDNNTKTHAWFTVYAPYEDPQIVITVLVEAGGEGNAAALPIAQQALEWWAKNRLNK